MILIADSGSSKTDWRLIDKNNEIHQFKTIGFNPFYQNQDTIYEALKTTLKPSISTTVEKIYFYGAGCAGKAKKEIVYQALLRTFPESEPIIASDLLAAARALCNQEEGIACILGTGGNSCLFDGNEIIENKRTYGFALGDEGSGAFFGKRVVADFLKGLLPADLQAKFQQRYKPDPNDILDNVYSKPMPNKYLASYAKFLFDNQRHPYIYQIIYDGFTQFFNNYVTTYENSADKKVHFVGSIAFYYSNILRQVANDSGMSLKNILESPIAGLTLYHQNEV